MSAAELRAKKRRERILGASDDRMALVTGQKISMSEPETVVDPITKPSSDENLEASFVKIDDESTNIIDNVEAIPLSWEERRAQLVEKTMADENTKKKAIEIVQKVEANSTISYDETTDTKLININERPMDLGSEQVKELEKIKIDPGFRQALDQARAVELFRIGRIIGSFILGVIFAFNSIYFMSKEQKTFLTSPIHKILVDAVLDDEIDSDADVEVVFGIEKRLQAIPANDFERELFSEIRIPILEHYALSLIIVTITQLFALSSALKLWFGIPILSLLNSEEMGTIMKLAISFGGSAVDSLFLLFQTMKYLVQDVLLILSTYILFICISARF